MRDVKKYSPEKKCKLEYDKLDVEGKIFVFRKVLYFIKLTLQTTLVMQSQ